MPVEQAVTDSIDSIAHNSENATEFSLTMDVSNALYSGLKEESGKTGKFHRDAKSRDYYVKTIKCDGVYYDVLINVKITENDKHVYDITLRRKK